MVCLRKVKRMLVKYLVSDYSAPSTRRVGLWFLPRNTIENALIDLWSKDSANCYVFLILWISNGPCDYGQHISWGNWEKGGLVWFMILVHYSKECLMWVRSNWWQECKLVNVHVAAPQEEERTRVDWPVGLMLKGQQQVTDCCESGPTFSKGSMASFKIMQQTLGSNMLGMAQPTHEGRWEGDTQTQEVHQPQSCFLELWPPEVWEVMSFAIEAAGYDILLWLVLLLLWCLSLFCNSC